MTDRAAERLEEVASGPGGTEASIWVNGTRRDAGEPHVSARDRGLLLADGVFETMLVRNGRVFRLDRHLARLSQSLTVLRIAHPGDLAEWIRSAVEAWPGERGSMRVTVTRGVGTGGVAPSPDPHPTVIVSVGPMPPFPAAVYEAGLSAHVPSGRRNERAVTAGLKTLSYTDAVAALLEAQMVNADEALLLDTEDHLSEASSSNLFVWTGGELLTPPVSCGALPGITRAAVIELAYGLRLEVSDRPFGFAELATAREAFLTSSLRGVAPLVRVGGAPIGSGTPGDITRRIAAAYGAVVNAECGP